MRPQAYNTTHIQGRVANPTNTLRYEEPDIPSEEAAEDAVIALELLPFLRIPYPILSITEIYTTISCP